MAYTDKEIIEGCLNNKRSFQELLYKTYASKMYGICLRYAKDKDTANDMLQEGFIRAFKYLDQFKFQSSLKSWLHTLFVRNCINFIKKYSRKNEISINDYNESEENNEQLTENEAEFWLEKISPEMAVEMLQKLPEKYRIALNLFAIDKLKHNEIATEMGISVINSRSLINRARKMMKELLNHKMSEFID